MMKSIHTLLMPVGVILLLSACNDVKQAELDEVRMRAEQKADQALANSP